MSSHPDLLVSKFTKCEGGCPSNFSVAFLRVTLDLREAPDLRVRRARKDPMVSSVPVDLLEAVERE